ncbi:MAG TPA: hypothetical protein VM054_02615 [bacterium]|nr:hypothetical protein [bacterium]
MIRRFLLVLLAGATITTADPGLIADYFPERMAPAHYDCLYTPRDAEPYSYELNRWYLATPAGPDDVHWVDVNMACRIEGDAVQFYDYSDGRLIVLPHRLEFPLEPGKTWTYTAPDGRSALAVVDYIDGVTVPYGTFDGCYRVAFTEQGVGEWTVVLAPGRGVIEEWGEIFGLCGWECGLVYYGDGTSCASPNKQYGGCPPLQP